ncbi:hypothetical protein GOX01_23320 [Gluconobacter oxydans]|uniref:Uncharacterized protein n=1 Tax=Gluconobacter oxydans TaxID=442 RepID=A0AB35AVE9_GLUOY|nr:hypothetical protein [Gluconobacter oxydans]KXV35602.1 hypothetical protein AD939_01495 [Gluconobacter oxydans]MBF0857414.1 hypothetical protein [Gluconobacter oxydans]TCW20630.1 hypothetical protein EDC20_1503 [Gluconobacter oxydans]GEC62001.1 hypothetical protein GOX01_23320 [Gluconobacter oxydans]
MPQTTAEIIADIDAMVARLETYRLELEARPVAHGYSETISTDDEDPETGFRLPTRPTLPRRAPRPPASGTTFPISGSGLAEPETLPAPPLFSPQPDWLAHVLTVTGPEAVLGQFQAEAAGTGRLSWGPDVSDPEDLGGILPAQDARTTALIDQIVQSQRGRLASEAGSGSVPFDLNTLCPMPLGLLALGPASPTTQAWLWKHWGTSRPLQQVEVMEGPPKENTLCWSVSFWSADWTPWAALQAIATRWPDLSFSIRPLYDV